uniref:N-acetyltransferase domain-containing protein n=1 Tax=viral metagenome TaxID=1070528 RepID=A0A6C0IZV4_9ZZZZ
MQEFNGLLSENFDNRVLNKYLKLLPKKYNIFCYLKIDSNCGFIFYIAENIQIVSVDEKFNPELCLGYITGFIDTTKIDMDADTLEELNEEIIDKLEENKDKKKILQALEGKEIKLNQKAKNLLLILKTRYIEESLTIAFVSVKKEYLGKGIGQFLMILACDFAMKKYDILKITLDDDTDNSWNLERNLYIRLGLWYINEEPNPEMEGLLYIVTDKWKAFKKYYTDNTRILYNGSKFHPFFLNKPV